VLQMSSNRRCESKRAHRAADVIHVLSRVEVDGAQDGLDGRCEQLVRHSSPLSGVDNDMFVKTNFSGGCCQIAVVANCGDQIVTVPCL
jgi:hypothetical protein